LIRERAVRFFTVFPLMIIPVVIYNILALGGATLSTVDDMRARLDTDVFEIPMTSGVIWHITPGHALIAGSLLVLFFELLKSTGIGRAAVMNRYGGLYGYNRGCAPGFCDGRWLRRVIG